MATRMATAEKNNPVFAAKESPVSKGLPDKPTRYKIKKLNNVQSTAGTTHASGEGPQGLARLWTYITHGREMDTRMAMRTPHAQRLSKVPGKGIGSARLDIVNHRYGPKPVLEPYETEHFSEHHRD